jgi:hypothetical protein
VIQAASARLRERFGFRQEIVIALGHGPDPSSDPDCSVHAIAGRLDPRT